MAPILFSSPHSGRDYHPDFLAMSRLAPLALRASEDGFVDELFAAVPTHGATLLAARFPRAWCDANREAWELDPTMFEDRLPAWVNTQSARVSAGLGTIARLVSTGEPIYRQRLHFAEAQRRIAQCWQPYHDILTRLIEELRAECGACLVVDCHSMPAHACQGRQPAPDIVLGDAHGAACAPGLTRLAEQFLGDIGYIVRRNDPYSGGYITRHYGKPARRVHALQIEIARGLYMREESLEKTDAFPRLAADMAALAALLARQAGRLMRD